MSFVHTLGQVSVTRVFGVYLVRPLFDCLTIDHDNHNVHNIRINKNEAYNTMLVRGYPEFLDFEQAAYERTAPEGARIKLFPSDRAEFRSENEWVDNNLKLTYSVLHQLAAMIKSGCLPANTTIDLYISNYANKEAIKDFTQLAEVIKPGGCPHGFVLNIHFDYSKSDKSKRNLDAEKEFSKHWIPPLAEVLECGRCPAGFQIRLLHPSVRHVRSRLDDALAVYHRLLAQQQSVVLAQGVSQPGSDLSKLPVEVTNLICCFLLYPVAGSQKMITTFQSKLMEISAKCFLENYWSFNPSVDSKLFTMALQQILASNLSVLQKAQKIRNSSALYLESSLGKLEESEYKKQEGVKLARKFHLFQAGSVAENPESSGEFRLNSSLMK